MKNKDLSTKLEELKELDDIVSYKFVIALAKNKKLIQDAIEELKEIVAESEEYSKIVKEIEEFKKEFSTKDSDGNPKIKTEVVNERPVQTYDITDSNRKKLSKKLVEYTESNKEVIDKQRAKEEEFFKALEVECEIKFNMVKEDAIPKDITPKQLEATMFMINW